MKVIELVNIIGYIIGIGLVVVSNFLLAFNEKKLLRSLALTNIAIIIIAISNYIVNFYFLKG